MAKKFLSIILTICMLLSLMPSAAFADEGPGNVVTLDIAKGPITITATGYKAEGAASETSYTGSYVITGTSTAPINNLTIAGQSTGSAITLNDLDITTAGPEALSISGGSPINVAIGEQGVKLSNIAVGIYIKENTPFSMNGTGDLTVITGAPALQGGGNLFSVETEGNILFDGIGLLYGMGDISLISSGGNVSVAGRSAPSINCNNVNIKAKNNIDISNTNLFCIAAVSCALESTDGKISVATKEGNAPTISCSDINIKAKNDIDLSSAKSLCLSSENNIVVESTDGGVSVATKEVCGSPTISAKGSVTIKAKNDIDVSSVESLCLNSQSNITVESTEGSVSVVSKEAMGSPTISAQGAFIINAKNDILVSNKNSLCITGNSVTDVKFNSASGSIKVTTEATVNPAIANCKNITVTAPVGGVAISNNALNNGAPVAACGSFSVTEGTVCTLSGGVNNMLYSIANDGSKDRIIATITTPLNFNTPINPDGYGYKWDTATKTLTLNNLRIATDGGVSAIAVPDGTTVILNNTSNIISTSSGGGGIEAIGSLNIEGNGTLNIKAYGGINSNGGKITFSGGTVNLDCNLAAIAVTYQSLNNIDAIPQNIVLDTDKVYVKAGGSLVSSAWVKREGSKSYIACNTFSEGGFVFNPPVAVTGVSAKVVIAQISCINISDVSGVAVPVKNGSPVKTITETSQYTGTVTWTPADTTFALDTAYTATINIMPKSGYTLKGVAENFFNITGATCTNIADSGIITAVFPKTANGGSSGGGGSKITPTPTIPTATPENSADVTTVKLGTKISGGTATGIITESDAKNIIENALKNNSDKIVIEPSVEGESQKVAVEIPKTAVSDLAGKTDSKLVVATPIADVNISSEGLADIAAATGSKVTISAEMKNDLIVIEIKSDNKVANNIKGGISISIPAEKITAGTVAVLVKEDGTTEVIKKTASKDGNIIIPLNGSATIKIIDNKKIFDDVKAEDWYSSAAAFVSSRGLFGGTGNNSFGPNESMTRGMLVTVLHRLENKPAGGNHRFLDVDPGAYYADAVSWASANSIVSGNGQNFMPDDDITREQLAVMLYNYSKINGYDTTQGGMAIREFADFDRISPWASEAMGWANASGLMSGKGNNTIDPSGTAKRAEVAAILERFIEMTAE